MTRERQFPLSLWEWDKKTGEIKSLDKLIATVHGATVHNQESDRETTFDYARLITYSPALFKAVLDIIEFFDELMPRLEYLRDKVYGIDVDKKENNKDNP